MNQQKPTSLPSISNDVSFQMEESVDKIENESILESFKLIFKKDAKGEEEITASSSSSTSSSVCEYTIQALNQLFRTSQSSTAKESQTVLNNLIQKPILWEILKILFYNSVTNRNPVLVGLLADINEGIIWLWNLSVMGTPKSLSLMKFINEFLQFLIEFQFIPNFEPEILLPLLNHGEISNLLQTIATNSEKFKITTNSDNNPELFSQLIRELYLQNLNEKTVECWQKMTEIF